MKCNVPECDYYCFRPTGKGIGVCIVHGEYYHELPYIRRVLGPHQNRMIGYYNKNLCIDKIALKLYGNMEQVSINKASVLLAQLKRRGAIE